MQTVKDLASSLGVTAQTIRNEIKRQNIAKQRNLDENGSFGFCLCDEDAARIIQAIESRKEQNAKAKAGAKQKQKVENKSKTQVGDLLLQLDAKQKQIDDLQTKLDAVQAKLDAKEEEFAALFKSYTEQVHSLTVSIEKMTENMKAAQVLHAEAIQNRIEQHTDKKWWQFWK